MSKKLIALLMASLMLLSVAAACGKTETPSTSDATQPGENNTPAATTPAADGEKVYKTYLTSEIASLNFLDNVDGNADTPAS